MNYWGYAPSGGYPKLHVKKSGAEIAGSPFSMSFVSGAYTTGVIYGYSKTLGFGTDYTYFFEAQDTYNEIATGVPTSEVDAPDVVNAVPTLAWTGEANYTTDGTNPNTGNVSTNFIFRVKYADANGDAPAAGYPKLHIKKGGAEIAGSPFLISFVSGAYATGAIYSYTKTLATGTDYTYYFEAQDIWNDVATGAPLTPVAGPVVSNNSPVLNWTGEANYTADGLTPESGDRNANFIFQVKYSDADNQAPNAGYPALHIKQGGTEITGSPFAMNFVSGAYTTGAIYTYTKALTPGLDYTYYFEAQDSDGVDAEGAPTAEIDAPDVSNLAPTLAWTDETNYANDSVYPKTGAASENFIFRVKCTDADNDAPDAGYPRVRIKRSGAEISGSPFAMTFVSGAFNAGAVYTLPQSLAAGEYSYLIEAQDIYAGQATGNPLTEKTGLVVIGDSVAPPVQTVNVYHGVFKPGQNEKTIVAFNLSAPARITIKVYNTAGQKVKDLYEGSSPVGVNSIQWDGKNDGGQKVSSGVYTIKIEGGGVNQSRRVVVVR